MVNLNAKMSLGFIVFTFFKTMVPNVRLWEKKSCFLLKKKIFWWNYSNFCVKIIKKGLKFLLLSASSKKISASRAVGISASSSASKLPASSSTSCAVLPALLSTQTIPHQVLPRPRTLFTDLIRFGELQAASEKNNAL